MQSTRKPLPLVASTLWWTVLTVGGFVYETYLAFLGSRIEGSYSFLVILLVPFYLTCALLWFLRSYWQGQDWTRDLVRIGLVLKLGIQLFGVFNIRHIPHTLARQALFALLVGDMIFSSYILFWLFTKEAKDYFRFPRADWSTDQQGKVVP